MNRAIFHIVIAILVLMTSSLAAVPKLINYQGRTTDSSGAPINGSFPMTFKLYSLPVSGTAYWIETHPAVIVDDGLFDVVLGSESSFDGIEPDGEEFWMGITIGVDPEISPRTRWLSVPFAFQANRADTASFSYQAGFVDTAQYASQAGWVDTAQYASQAGWVDTAQYSNLASWADTAQYANQAGWADTAWYSNQALQADTATYAHSSRLSDTAGIALGATNSSIGSSQLIDNNVTSVDIENGTIASVDISANAITGSHIAAGVVNSSHITDGSIQLGDLADVGATDGQVIKWNAASSSWDLAEDETVPSGSDGWMDDGQIVRMTAIDDSVGIGTATPAEKLDVSGNIHASGTIISGNSITIDGASDKISASGGVIDFDDEDLITTGRAAIGPGSSNKGLAVVISGSDNPTANREYGISIEANGTNGNTTYGQYTDLKKENAGQIYGEYNKVESLNSAPSHAYASFNYARKETSAGNGRLYGLASQAWNYNLTNTAAVYGVYAYGYSASTSGNVYGIYARGDGGATGYAGYFLGDVHITGVLSKSGGSFKIDHPVDPENKYLQHSFVESPDMKNIYDGNVSLDGNGEALVILPDYFEALNMEFRYQLTAIGSPGPNLYVSEKITNHRFRISGGSPFSEVSWQVTGIRQDAWAIANRIEVEVDKQGNEVGLYINAKAHGQPPEKDINYENLREAPQNEDSKHE